MKYLAMASSTKQLGPACTRKQAAELLESLRAEYQALPPNERWLLPSVIQAVARGNADARQSSVATSILPMLQVPDAVAYIRR